MRRTFPTLLLLALVSATAACASGGRTTGGAVEPRLGTYQFRQTVAGTSPTMVLEGTVVVRPDTIMVEVLNEYCTYNTGATTTTRIAYTCSGAGGGSRISVDRRNPVGNVSYSVSTTVMVPVRRCVAYRSNSRECAEYVTEHEERPAQRSGRLQLVFRP